MAAAGAGVRLSYDGAGDDGRHSPAEGAEHISLSGAAGRGSITAGNTARALFTLINYSRGPIGTQAERGAAGRCLGGGGGVIQVRSCGGRGFCRLELLYDY